MFLQAMSNLAEEDETPPVSDRIGESIKQTVEENKEALDFLAQDD